MKKVLFVCLGNICRSPLAEAVFNHKCRNNNLEADSAGTGAYHIGADPDPRSVSVATKNGIPIDHKARQFQNKDFDEFDFVIAMDQQNKLDMIDVASEAPDNLFLMRDFDESAAGDLDVPDPYYGGNQGFDVVFEMVSRSIDNLIKFIEEGETS